jgi:hypothetical protein
MSRVSGFEVVTVSWDPSSISDGDEAATTVSVPGAELGDFVMHTHDIDVSDLASTAHVTSADTVSVVLANNTGGSVNLSSHNVRVKVVPKEVM